MGLEEEAVFYLLQRATSEHKIRSAFTRGSIRGSIYVEGILDANMITLLNVTPGIRKISGLLCQTIDPSDWVKLLTMRKFDTVEDPSQWVRVRNGVYKGDIGFVTHVEGWGVQVLVVPRLKIPTPQAAASLKRKRSAAIRPEQRLFDPVTFSSVFQREAKLHYNGTYTSARQVFDHGLLCRNLDFHSIFLNSTGVPSEVLRLFKLSSHPSLTGFPRPEEWIFEEGERVTVCSSRKEAKITAVKPTHLEVDLATDEGIEAVSWYNVHKVFTPGDFVSVTSGSLRGTMGWVDRIAGETVDLLEYKEKGNVSTHSGDIKVSFNLIPGNIY